MSSSVAIAIGDLNWDKLSYKRRSCADMVDFLATIPAPTEVEKRTD